MLKTFFPQMAAIPLQVGKRVLEAFEEDVAILVLEDKNSAATRLFRIS